MKKFLIAVGVFSLVGCMSTDPYTGQQKVSNTAKGAGIGAVTGALIGVATSSDEDRGKGALIGAASGAAVGGSPQDLKYNAEPTELIIGDNYSLSC